MSKTRFLGELERCVPEFKKRDVNDAVDGGKRRRFVVIQGIRLLDADL
ncbi:hypothetical protein [Xylella fastidiosa]|nr:hypothetical protein [Xylella fastidiosa]MBE0282979.1 hypothetical protein [Xylella fastidiosa subsp. multiplex]